MSQKKHVSWKYFQYWNKKGELVLPLYSPLLKFYRPSFSAFVQDSCLWRMSCRVPQLNLNHPPWPEMKKFLMIIIMISLKTNSQIDEQFYFNMTDSLQRFRWWRNRTTFRWFCCITYFKYWRKTPVTTTNSFSPCRWNIPCTISLITALENLKGKKKEENQTGKF